MNDVDGNALPEVQDWQKDGYFGNSSIGIHHAPDLNLIPFFFATAQGLSVSQFKFRQVTVGSRHEKIVTTNVVTLTSGWLVQNAGTFQDFWTFNASNEISFPDEGIYEFYILFDDGSEYISELICIPRAEDIFSCLPDFNADFNADHLICS